jgi:hypothetical protein
MPRVVHSTWVLAVGTLVGLGGAACSSSSDGGGGATGASGGRGGSPARGGAGGGGAAGTCLPSPTIAGDLAPQWAVTMGGGYSGKVKVDPGGNIIAMGIVTGALAIDGRTLVADPGDGNTHAFLLALDRDGKPLWSRLLGVDWTPSDLVIDPAGNIYLVGARRAGATTPIDLGTGPITGPLVVGKLDGQGNPLWSNGIDGVVPANFELTHPPALAVDGTGRIAVAGQAYLPSLGPDTDEAFLAWYDQTGAHLSTTIDGGGAVPAALAFEAAGNLVMGGSFQGALGWHSTVTSSSGSAFLMKLDPAQNLLWSSALGEYSQLTALATDGSRIWAAGTFSTSIALGGDTLVAQGLADTYVATIDDGTAPAARILASYAGASDSLTGLAPDGHGGIWATGGLEAVVDFGTGLTLPIAQVVLHLDGTGRTTASGAFPLPMIELPRVASLATDPAGHVYVYGSFDDVTDLGLGLVHKPYAPFGTGMYLARYDDAPPAATPSFSCPAPPGALLGPDQSVQPKLLALAGQTVLYASTDAIMTIPVTGGSPVVFAHAQKRVSAMAVHDTTLFWTNEGGGPGASGPPANGSVVSQPLAGGTATVLASGQSLPRALAVDGTNVYWTTTPVDTMNATDANLWSVPVTGGAPTKLAGPFVRLGPVAAAGGVVIFAATSGTILAQTTQIMKVSAAGGDATPVVTTAPTVTSIAFDGSTIFWGEEASVQHPMPVTPDGRIRRANLDGSMMATLVDQQTFPRSLTTANGTLTWSNGETLWSLPTSGGTPSSIATGVDQCAADAAHLAWTAMDSTVYWKLVVAPR